MTTTEQLEAAPPPSVVAARPARAEPGVAARPSGWHRLATLAIALVALSPFVVGAASIVDRGFPPGALFGDRALLGLAAVDAWRAPVLLGPYSRFYWHHPGPSYFYVLNAWSTVFGNGTVGLALGAVAINVAGASGILALALRRGGRALMVWASVLLTVYLVAIHPIPFDIWNPSVTLLPFVVVLLLAWSIACRDWWTAPWFAVAASFVVQTHVGLAPGVAMALLFAVAVAYLRVRRSEAPFDDAQRTRVVRAALVSIVAAIVLWLPPVIEELTSREGNFTLLWRFFTRPGSPHTLSEGITNTGLQATLALRSVFEPVSLRVDAHQGLAAAVAISAPAFVVAVALARRVRAADTLVLLVFVAVELIVGVYAVTRVVGPIQFYLVQWISAVGFLLWLAIGSAVLAWARAHATGFPRWLPRAAMLVLVGVLCVGAVRAFPGDAGLVNEDLDVPNNRALFGYVPGAQLLEETRPDRRVVLRLDSLTAWEVMAADALLLVQHGRDVKVVDSPVTRLLFDDSLRVHRATGPTVLAFRDRADPRIGRGDSFVADQGEWTIVRVDGP